jgi:hypothetical protein
MSTLAYAERLGIAVAITEALKDMATFGRPKTWTDGQHKVRIYLPRPWGYLQVMDNGTVNAGPAKRAAQEKIRAALSALGIKYIYSR